MRLDRTDLMAIFVAVAVSAAFWIGFFVGVAE